MDLKNPFSEKQKTFILNANSKINLAHGSVRSGKTVCTLYSFLLEAMKCQDSDIWMIGHTSNTVYDNVIQLIFNNKVFSIFRAYANWSNRTLYFGDKQIKVLGAKDEGAIKAIQGKTMSLCYCDEFTLYPESIIDMIDTRMSPPGAKLFASMNPSHPSHKLKTWIDKGVEKNQNYYSLHFTLEDNPFLEQSYIDRIKSSLSGVFYRRYYLGEWCMAEGAIFDFFDKKYHVCQRPPCAAEYWIAGVDWGMKNAFACVLVGINTGMQTQTGKQAWVEKELYWDCLKTGYQKTASELADEVKELLEPYYIKGVYTDPSAASFRLDLSRRGVHVVEKVNNEIEDGIRLLTSAVKDGWLTILACCPNLIREVESYVWNEKKVLQGDEKPVKKNDHAVDALRYAIATHKILGYDPNRKEMYEKDFGRALGFKNLRLGW